MFFNESDDFSLHALASLLFRAIMSNPIKSFSLDNVDVLEHYFEIISVNVSIHVILLCEKPHIFFVLHACKHSSKLNVNSDAVPDSVLLLEALPAEELLT